MLLLLILSKGQCGAKPFLPTQEAYRSLCCLYYLYLNQYNTMLIKHPHCWQPLTEALCFCPTFVNVTSREHLEGSSSLSWGWIRYILAVKVPISFLVNAKSQKQDHFITIWSTKIHLDTRMKPISMLIWTHMPINCKDSSRNRTLVSAQVHWKLPPNLTVHVQPCAMTGQFHNVKLRLLWQCFFFSVPCFVSW